MTKRIINLALIITAIFLLGNPIINGVIHLINCKKDLFDICYENKAAHGIAIGLIIGAIVILAFFVYLYLVGELDNFINKNIEPKVNQFYDFLNRRNK